MRNVSDESYRESQNTHFMFNNFFFFKSCLNEIIWENVVQPDRRQMTIWRVRIEWWMSKAANPHS